MWIRIRPLYFGADPVPTFHFDADLDSVPHQSDANLQQLAFRPSEAPLRASTPLLFFWASTAPEWASMAPFWASRVPEFRVCCGSGSCFWLRRGSGSDFLLCCGSGSDPQHWTQRPRAEVYWSWLRIKIIESRGWNFMTLWPLAYLGHGRRHYPFLQFFSQSLYLDKFCYKMSTN